MIILLLFVLFLNSPVFAAEYGIYSYRDYAYENEYQEKILFILDFSNSMTDFLDGQRKVDVMLETMSNILLSVPSNALIGLRVYGHRGGFSAFDACRASTLMVSLGIPDLNNINSALKKLNPRGMTPITYSLKQAIKNDFLGVSGDKRIILLTDGGENCDESPCEYVMELVKVRKDVKIDVIAFGIQNEDDLSQLECTALVTSGKFYSANTAAELKKSLTNSITVKKEVEAKIFQN